MNVPANSCTAIAFPVVFPNACLNVQITVEAAVANYYFDTKPKTGFNLHNSAAATVTLSWRPVGN
jgi:hypothetical protein